MFTLSTPTIPVKSGALVDGVASLGTNTKSVNPSPDFSLARVSRWALQSAARSILSNSFRSDKQGRKQQEHRVSSCCRVSRSALVALKRRGDLHHYGNLQRCGSVWVCPVCASVIAERRRLELQEAVLTWTAGGGKVYMLTQTVPHYDSDSLVKVLDSFGKARKLQRNRKTWKKKISPLLAGTISALEVTHGQNGWHVHTHEILFVKHNTTLFHDEHSKFNLWSTIYETWWKACVSAGLNCPSAEHGVRLDENEYVSDYVSKWGTNDTWGIEAELTKANIKQGRKEGRTPFAILRDFLFHGDCEDSALFKTFAKAFKGKRQLVWSEGLKDLLLIEDKSDDTILEESEKGIHVNYFSVDQWRKIIKHDARGSVLEAANREGWPGVVALVNSLQEVKDHGKSQRSNLDRSRSVSGGFGAKFGADQPLALEAARDSDYPSSRLAQAQPGRGASGRRGSPPAPATNLTVC